MLNNSNISKRNIKHHFNFFVHLHVYEFFIDGIYIPDSKNFSTDIFSRDKSADICLILISGISGRRGGKYRGLNHVNRQKA